MMSMRWFRAVISLAVMACFAPMASTMAAAWIADRNGCRLHEGFVNPCVIGGVDWGGTLYNMAMMGWLMLATLPIALLLVGAWVVVELVRIVRRSRSRPAGGGP